MLGRNDALGESGKERGMGLKVSISIKLKESLGKQKPKIKVTLENL